MPAPPAITPGVCANNFRNPLERIRLREPSRHSENMSKERKKRTKKGRTDEQSTLAANELSVAKHDAQQPIQFCAVTNSDMNRPNDVSPDGEQTGQSTPVESAPIESCQDPSPP